MWIGISGRQTGVAVCCQGGFVFMAEDLAGIVAVVAVNVVEEGHFGHEFDFARDTDT